MSMSEVGLIAAALRMAADKIEGAIAAGDIAECAAPVEGESGRYEAVQSRDLAQEDPAEWLRCEADAIEAADEVEI
jgi:hypothetical protein